MRSQFFYSYNFKPRLAEDITLEDSVHTLVGKNEWKPMLEWLPRGFQCTDISIKEVYHGEHEIVLDYDLYCGVAALGGIRIPLSSYSHMILEPSIDGQPERLRLYQDELNRRPILHNQLSWPWSCLYRYVTRVTGKVLLKAIEKGWV